jgi:hypothetical protein
MNIETVTEFDIDYVIIDDGNGNFTKMTKAQYDTLPSELVNQAVPNA